MELSEIINGNADAFAAIPDAANVATTLATTLTDLGYDLIPNPKKEPGWIPKTRLDEVIGQKNQLNTQVGELTNQLEELKKSAKGNEKLIEQIEALQNGNTELQGKLQSVAVESAIKLAAMTAQANDPADVLHYIDKSKLVIGDDGSVNGIDDQLKAIKESKPYLFTPTGTQQAGGDFGGGNGKPAITEEYVRTASAADLQARMPEVEAFYKSKRK